jgi:hypothetical protein
MMMSDNLSDQMSNLGGASHFGGAHNGGHGGGADFYNGGMGGHKNPSTAAGTYVQGFGGPEGGFGGGHKSGGGLGFGTGAKYPGESFDLDIMMPPDIASIDSDISKALII